jgi:hypothetical protein
MAVGPVSKLASSAFAISASSLEITPYNIKISVITKPSLLSFSACYLMLSAIALLSSTSALSRSRGITYSEGEGPSGMAG